MLKLVYETRVAPTYDSKLKLKAFAEDYFGKMPQDNKTFVKMINFAGDVTVANVVGLEVASSVKDGPDAATKTEPAQINIVYSLKTDSKPYTCKDFAKWCKKVFEEVKDFDAGTILIKLREDDKKKTDNFRFFYDDETNTAIFARNCSVKRVVEYVEEHSADFAKSVKSPKVEKMKDKPKADGSTEQV